jgi:ABC-type multidrug transport system fused ATPase/permease subunit
MTLMEIIGQFRRPFIFAISLVIIEKLAWIVEPTVFGRLLDALIDVFGSKEKVSYALPLALWIGVFAINSGVGAIRRSVDEKIYLNMFSNIAVHITGTSREKGLEPTKIAARVELSREYITFLQYRIPDIIEQFFDLGGTIIALAFYDKRIAITCSCIAIPLIFMNRLYIKKVDRLQKELHDMREDVFETFATKSSQEIRHYYDSMAKPQRKIANWGALNFGALRLFLLGIFLLVLYIAIDLDDFTTGKMYSVVAYLWTFVTSTEHLPDLMESYSSIKEIQNRVRTETPAESSLKKI